MLFNPDRTVTLQSRTCHGCQGTKTVPGRKTCPTCKGTRRGSRGGRGRCKDCYNGTVIDRDNEIPCEHCSATPGLVPEDFYDSLLAGEMAALIKNGTLPVEFVEANRQASFNESFLGLGCVHSIGDYGTTWDRIHRGEELDVHNEIREELAKSWCQLCKIAKEDKATGIITLCNKLVVIINRGGYSVRASFTEDASPVINHANRELSESEGMAVGTRLAGEGMNGTLIAATLQK